MDCMKWCKGVVCSGFSGYKSAWYLNRRLESDVWSINTQLWTTLCLYQQSYVPPSDSYREHQVRLKRETKAVWMRKVFASTDCSSWTTYLQHLVIHDGAASHHSTQVDWTRVRGKMTSSNLNEWKNDVRSYLLTRQLGKNDIFIMWIHFCGERRTTTLIICCWMGTKRGQKVINLCQRAQ